MKPLLSGYKLIIGYVVGGIVITALVIVGVTQWHSLFDKKEPVTQTQTAPTPTNPLAQFDGSYTGTSDANQGVSAANVDISNGSITGNGTYVGSDGTQVSLKVTGTVNADGTVTGDLSGTGSAGNDSTAVSGTYSGKITGTTLTVNYNGSGGGESASGSITLTKK